VTENKFKSLGLYANLILNSVNEGIYGSDSEGRIIFCNPAAAVMLGYTVEEMIGQPAHDLIRHSRADGSRLSREECDHHFVLANHETRHVLDDVFWRKDGSPIPVEYTSTSIQEGEKSLGVVVAFKDITQRKRGESRLVGQNHVLQMIALGATLPRILEEIVSAVEQQSGALGSILLMDPTHGTLRFAAGAKLPRAYVEAIDRFPVGPNSCSCGTAAYRKQPVIVTDVEHDSLWREHRQLALAHGLRACWSVPILASDKEVLGTFAMYYCEAKQPLPEDVQLLESYAHLAGIAIQHQKSEQEIHYLAYHDPLTRLPNRAFFMSRIAEALQHTQKSAAPIAVLLIDMDRFKSINDSLGHSLGDLVLQAVGERLRACVSPDSTLARMGGDEFVILLTQNITEGHVTDLAKRITESFERPILVDGREFRLTTSVGISMSPQDGQDPDTLVKHADRAMYHAKDRGRSGFQVFTHLMNHKFSERLLLESDLQTALTEQQFHIDYQPRVHLQTDRMTSAEALIRWQHPQLGAVSPGDFIPIAEDAGLIGLIDNWVLQRVCIQIRSWQKLGLTPVPIAVNLSAMQFQQQDLVETIQRLLAEHQLEPKWMEIEITETTLMKNEEEAMKKISRLQEMGIRVSIDDFGVGYSSLGFLQHFAVDSLKIDQSFIRELHSGNTAIVSAIITLGHSLGLRVVAEGVETIAQRNFLRDRGCDEMQGFLSSRPVSAKRFAEFLGSPVLFAST